MYSCHLCALKKVTVEVPARTDSQDVKHWMEQVLIYAIADDHRKRSPRCMATSISEVMIPVSGADRVGGPAVM